MPDRALEEQAAAVASLLPRIMGGLNRIDMEDPTTEQIGRASCRERE